jgi:HPr Serine kinase C-terminal domain
MIKTMNLRISEDDPLLYDFDLPFRANYYFLGFAVEVLSNSADVLAAAEESWGMFRPRWSEPPIQIRIGVLPGGTGPCPPQPTCRGQRNLITQVVDADNYMVMDVRQGFAFGWLTEAAVENRAYLRYYFLEGTAWTLLESLYLTSVHAACVELNGHGILLCGDSGAGKSSLAYACAQNGWKFLADDSCCLIRSRTGRAVTGNPYQMRFRESAVNLFPELMDQRMTPRATGDMAIELPTARTPEIQIIAESSVDYIVFLNRFGAMPVGLARFSKEKALQWFEQVVCYGESHIRAAHCTALRNLLSADVLEMRYAKMDTALYLLETLVRGRPFVVEAKLNKAEERENA